MVEYLKQNSHLIVFSITALVFYISEYPLGWGIWYVLGIYSIIMSMPFLLLLIFKTKTPLIDKICTNNFPCGNIVLLFSMSVMSLYYQSNKPYIDNLIKEKHDKQLERKAEFEKNEEEFAKKVRAIKSVCGNIPSIDTNREVTHDNWGSYSERTSSFDEYDLNEWWVNCISDNYVTKHKINEK